MDSKKKQGSLIKIIGINLLVIFFIIICFEIGCRLTKTPFRMRETPPEGFYSEFDPEMGWSYIPKKSLTWEFGEPKRSVNIIFDADGIRIPSESFQFDYQKPSVLFVGCSFTFGHGLPFEETFPGLFAKFPDTPLQIVNLGVQAYGTDQSLIMLQKFIKKFKTKLVVYTFIDEHLQRNGNYDRRMLYRKSRFPGTKPLYKLDKKGELYIAAKPKLYKDYHFSWLLAKLTIDVGGDMGIFPPKPKDVTEALIREMARISHENGADFVVLNWYSGNEDSYGFIQSIKDLNIIGNKDAMVNWQELGIPGDGHPGQEAHMRSAKILYDHFLEIQEKKFASNE